MNEQTDRVFKGFTEEQTAKIAQKLGFSGPLDGFNQFLASNPQAASSFASMSQKAQSFLQKGQERNFSSGGLVVAQTTNEATTTTTPAAQPQVVPFAKSSSSTQDEINRSLDTKTANIPSAAFSKTANIRPARNQLIPGSTGQIDPVSGQLTAATPNQIQEDEAAQYQADTTAAKVDQTASGNEATQGTVSQQGQVQAQTSDPNQLTQLGLDVPQMSQADKIEGTVQQQLTNLMQTFEGGKTPPWAAGVLRSVNAQMAARGLDASSMAGQAAVQAAMEAATAIAGADAQLLSNANLANLDVRKQKMLSDAAAMSAMDMANLNNRQQAAVLNAQAFLQMDYKNLDVKAQTDAMNFQARVNSLLSDSAQVNAARQFNATSENQTNQFFANLAANVDVQRAEMQNDTNQFNSSLLNQRDQFNAQNAVVIAQANAQWRQQITTTNTAAQNLNNQLNAQTVARMNETAFNAMIQIERDEMNYINDALNRSFTGSENKLERENRLLIESLSRDARDKLAKMGYKFETGKATGEALTGVATTILKAGLDSGFGNIFKW